MEITDDNSPLLLVSVRAKRQIWCDREIYTAMGSLRVGLIGAGAFGRIHADKIAMADVVFCGIYDQDHTRAKSLARQHQTSVFTSIETMLHAIDAVIIAAPASAHFDLATQALTAGCHVLVEKPLALNLRSAYQLVNMANAADLILQVGHQERLVCKTIGLFDIPEPPITVHISRVCPMPDSGRGMDVSVIWDLMIHDIDLMHCLFGPKVEVIACNAASHADKSVDYAEAIFKIGVHQSTLCASRMAMAYDRTMRLKYANGEIEIDFLKRSVRNTTPYRLAAPDAVLMSDPLGSADLLFFQACRRETNPVITGEQVLAAISTAQALHELAGLPECAEV